MDFDKLLDELKEEIVAEAKSNFGEEAEIVVSDMQDYLKTSKEKLKKWTGLYLDKSIDEDELAWLLKSQKDLLTMRGLYKIGVGQLKIARFKNRIIGIVFNKLVGMVL